MSVKRSNTPRHTPQVQTRMANQATATLTYVRDTKNYHVFEDKSKQLSTGAIYLSKEELGETAPANVTILVTF